MRKVLLVDDSSLIQKMVTLLFAQKNELELVYAASYLDAQEIIKGGKKFFAAIVCIVLPDALEGEMVDLSLSFNIPTLVLTGSLGEEIRRSMSKKPIIDYISKNTQNDISYAVELIHTLYYFENKKVLFITQNRNDQIQIKSYFSHILLKPIHAQSFEDAQRILKEDSFSSSLFSGLVRFFIRCCASSGYIHTLPLPITSTACFR